MRTLAHSCTVCGMLVHSGTVWRSFGVLWRILAQSGALLRSVWHVGALWHSLALSHHAGGGAGQEDFHYDRYRDYLVIEIPLFTASLSCKWMSKSTLITMACVMRRLSAMSCGNQSRIVLMLAKVHVMVQVRTI